MMLGRCAIVLVTFASTAVLLDSGHTYAADTERIQATGHSAIFKNDKAGARKKAIREAQRRAVQEAMSGRLPVDPIIDGYRHLDERILSKPSRYLHAVRVVTEREDSGVLEVTIEAELLLPRLQADLDRLFAVPESVNVPRVALDLDERTADASADSTWWTGDRDLSTVSGVVEATITDAWQRKAVPLVNLRDEPNRGDGDDTARERAVKAGAEMLVMGSAVAHGRIQPHTFPQQYVVEVELSLRALDLSDGTVAAVSTHTKRASDPDGQEAARKALRKTAEAGSKDLLVKLLRIWEHRER